MKYNKNNFTHLKDGYFSLKSALQDYEASKERLDETLAFCAKLTEFQNKNDAKKCLNEISAAYSRLLISGDFLNG